MIIRLSHAMFDVNPDIRFSGRRGVSQGLLFELYRRQKVLSYDLQDLKELYFIRTKKVIDRKNLWTWLKMLEVYERAQEAKNMGALEVTEEWFGDNIEFILKRIKI